ncbi:hypothetical protein MUP59_09950, partial [Candidatus Bathyarchaeota archaeon]|nr:hypothetical protein [Candidatus Bathyarchaeota archaeon]
KSIWLLLFLILPLFVGVAVVSAGSNTSNIHIKVKAGGPPGSPINFTAIIVDSNEETEAWFEVELTWGLGIEATSTIIIRKEDPSPALLTDWQLIYDGNAEIYNDTVAAEDTDTMFFCEDLYYTAWSKNEYGYSAPVDFQLEVHPNMVNAVMLLALGILALVPTIAAFALKSGRSILGFMAAGMWVILGVYSYTQSEDTWDISYAIFWISMGMVIVCSLVAVVLKEKKEEEITEDYGEDKELMEQVEADEKDREKFRRIYGSRRGRARKGGKLSNFAKTGREKIK